MAEETPCKAQENAQVEIVPDKACQPDGHEGQGIVKEHLHGMQDEGVLQEIHETVEKACHGTHGRAEAPGDEHDGQHGAKGQVAPLGEMEYLQLLQDDGEGQHKGNVDHHLGGEPGFAQVNAASRQGEKTSHGKDAGGTGDEFCQIKHFLNSRDDDCNMSILTSWAGENNVLLADNKPSSQGEGK